MRWSLTVGKINLWRHDVKEAMKQPAGMFTLIDSRRYRCD